MMDSHIFCRKISNGNFKVIGRGTDPYLYIEDPADTLHIWQLEIHRGLIKPIMWAQSGRYGWLSKEQVQNMVRRQIDLAKQQAGYAKDKPLDLAFHWDDVTELDPVTVRLMREPSP